MRKALIWSALTLLLVLLSCMADDLILSRRCESWTAQLQTAERAAQAADWPSAAQAVTALRRDWEGWQEYLHIVINHTAISDAQQLLERCRLAVETRDEETFREAATDLHCQLRLLSELEQLSLKNVL